jgi:hypothetical protein
MGVMFILFGNSALGHGSGYLLIHEKTKPDCLFAVGLKLGTQAAGLRTNDGIGTRIPIRFVCLYDAFSKT